MNAILIAIGATLVVAGSLPAVWPGGLVLVWGGCLFVGLGVVDVIASANRARRRRRARRTHPADSRYGGGHVRRLP